MILSSSTTVDLYPFFIGHYTPSPSTPVPFGPSFILIPPSLPLLTRLLRYQVTVHLSAIVNPDIAEVTRLASLLSTSSTPSSVSPPQSRLTRDQAHDTVHGSVSITCTCGIARHDTKSRLRDRTILRYHGSSWITIRSSDLFGNLWTFHLWLRSSDLLWIILGSI